MATEQLSQLTSLPLEVIAMSRPPISGSYLGKIKAPSLGVYEVELRIDLDQSHEQSPVLHRVSWDVFQVFTSGEDTWRVYQESWVTDSPVMSLDASGVTISGDARSWTGSQVAIINVTIPRSEDSIGVVKFVVTRGLQTEEYDCEWQSAFFRRVDLQIDVCKSVNSAPLLPTYNTHWHNDRPASVLERDLTIELAYAEMGIDVDIPATHTVIDDSDPEFVSWTSAELHEAMVDHYSALRNSPQWLLWGLMAGIFERSSVGGIMFDVATLYGGAGQAPERQGFAVFRNHSWFDELVDTTPTTQAQAEAARKFLYTWVHEAGHAFNHLHSWDKSRPDSLSWMNYDWKYDDRNGSDQFWRNFEFRFDNPELLHLRHGSRNAVIMGGDTWASGGHLESEHTEVAHLEIVAGSPPVEVLVRSKELFQFMEPVNVEIRLRNTSKKRLELDTDLDPEFGVVTLLVRGPDGFVHQYEPLMCKLAERSQMTLSTANKTQTGSDRYSQLVDVTFGKRGFYFDRPGQYAIRAIYQGVDGTLIPSALHYIRVGYPMTQDAERIAQDYFTHDVGLAIYLNGSQSKRMSNAM